MKCVDDVIVQYNRLRVTSYAEVWIEIEPMYDITYEDMSPPTRRCGLKSKRNH